MDRLRIWQRRRTERIWPELEENFKKFLRKEPIEWASATIVKPVAAQSDSLLLVPGGTAAVPALKVPFVVRVRFVVNTGRRAEAKISEIWGQFDPWFSDRVEPPFPGSALRYADLSRDSKDGPIITELGGPLKARTTLYEMFRLMAAQRNGPKGKAGPLLTNGSANVFYVEDGIRSSEDETVSYTNETGQRSVLRAVRALWLGDGWVVGAVSVLRPVAWVAGFRVFSRNSCGASVPQAA